MTPALAFLPNSVDCGPFSTSIRCTLIRSFNEPAVRDRNTLSMNTPTEGSIPKLFAPLPNPRMMKVVLDELCNVLTRSEGATVCRSEISRICACSSVSPEVTLTEIGTSCKVCSRFVAVTIITFSSSTESGSPGP